MKNWCRRFQHGPVSFQDKFREDRLRSIIVLQNIDTVRELSVQDYHVTYYEIDAFLGFIDTSINKIFYEYLTVKTIHSCWIPHNFSNAQKKADID